MRLHLVSFALVAVVLGSVTISCSHEPDSGIKGSFTYVGGPSPGISRREPGEVTLHASDGVEVARSSVAEGERFTIALAPGMYRLEGSSGDADCADQAVTVPEGQFIGVEIRCTIK